MEKFAFGTVERFTVGQMQRDEVKVKACTRMIAKLIVYSSHADVPFVARIGYSNGIAN
jgi:hypothetical protein